MAIESASVNMGITEAMMVGNKTMKQINEKMNADAVSELQDDIIETLADSQDINNIISQPVGMFGNLDDEETLKELQEMVEGDLETDLDKELEDLTKSDSAPTAKKSPVMKANDRKKIEKDELAFVLPNVPTEAVNSKNKVELSILGSSSASKTVTKSVKTDVEDDLEELRKQLAI